MNPNIQQVYTIVGLEDDLFILGVVTLSGVDTLVFLSSH